MVEEMREIWPFVTAVLTFLGGLFLERRMRAANAAKTEAEAEAKRAEARRVLAEAEKILAEADGEEARTMGSIIGAYKELYDEMKEEYAHIRAEQKKQHEQHELVLAELAWYRRGVAILIRQLERLDIIPEWTPEMPRNGGK